MKFNLRILLIVTSILVSYLYITSNAGWAETLTVNVSCLSEPKIGQKVSTEVNGFATMTLNPDRLYVGEGVVSIVVREHLKPTPLFEEKELRVDAVFENTELGVNLRAVPKKEADAQSELALLNLFQRNPKDSRIKSLVITLEEDIFYTDCTLSY